MARCFVVGASGAIGRFLLPRLMADGHDTIALSRSEHQTMSKVTWTVGALDAGTPAPQGVDAIFSLGPLDVFARWFATADIEGAPRVIAFGSTSIDTKRVSHDAVERDLAERLRDAELELCEAAMRRGCAWTIFRPTLIYGAGTDRSLSPLARFGTRWRVFPRIAAARGLRQPVHGDDLAAAVIAAWNQAVSFGKTYALGGGERLTFAQMLERVRRSLPVRALPVPVPLAALWAGVALARALGIASTHAGAIERLRGDLLADDADARRDFGWSPRRLEPDADTWIPVNSASPRAQ